MSVSATSQAQVLIAKAAAATAPSFVPGQVLEALVLGRAPDGMVAIRIGDMVVSAQLPQSLPAGTTLQLQVMAGGATPQLAIVGQPQAPVAPMPAPLPPPVEMPVVMLAGAGASPVLQQPQAPVLPQQPTVPNVPQVVAAQTPPPVVPSQPPAATASAPQAPVPSVPTMAGAPPAPVPPTAVAATPAPPKTELAQPLAPQSAPVTSSSAPAAIMQPSQPSAPTAPQPAATNPPPVTAQTPPAPASPAPSAPSLPTAPQPAPTAPTATVSSQPAVPTSSAPAPQVATASVATQPTAPSPAVVVAQQPANAAPPVPAAASATPAPQPVAPQPGPIPTAPVISTPQPPAPQAPAATIPTQPASTAATIEPNPLLLAQGAARPAALPAELPRMMPQPAPAQPGGPTTAAQATPATPQAALAQMVPEALARQNSLAPLLTTLAASVARTGALPEPVMRAALQVLAQRVPVSPNGPTAQTIAAAVAKSGLYLEAGLARGVAQPDMKAGLVALKGALANWLGGNPAPLNPVRQAAPPLRGMPPRAELPDQPLLPDMPREAGRLLHSQADAALSRVKLMQFASLPDADPTRNPVPELRMELPFLIGNELVMAQLQVFRDGARQKAEQKRGWTMRFAVNFSGSGEVGAEIGLLGRTVSVALWAADRDMAERLNAALPDLAPALAGLGLEAGAIRVRNLPPDAPKPASGHFVDSVS